MLRKGMVERQLEALSLVLAKLLKLDGFVGAEQGEELLQASCQELTGLKWSLAKTLPPDSLLQFLTVGGSLDAGRAASLAVVLQEQAKIDATAGRAGLAHSRNQAAYQLLLAAMEKESLLNIPLFQERMRDLRAVLERN